LENGLTIKLLLVGNLILVHYKMLLKHLHSCRYFVNRSGSKRSTFGVSLFVHSCTGQWREDRYSNSIKEEFGAKIYNVEESMNLACGILQERCDEF
jgi:hypothetical protein